MSLFPFPSRCLRYYLRGALLFRRHCMLHYRSLIAAGSHHDDCLIGSRLSTTKTPHSYLRSLGFLVDQEMSEDGEVKTPCEENNNQEDEDVVELFTDRKSSPEMDLVSRVDAVKEEHRRKSKKCHKETRRRRSRSSSSRDTFDNIEFSADDLPPRMDYRCGQCPKAFASIHDACVHEIRTHDTRNPCAVCGKVLRSPARLSSHFLLRHGRDPVQCRFCDEKFGSRADNVSEKTWDEFREHSFREILRRKIRDYSARGPDSVALRGVGRCPHGPAVRCKNFPNCPGAKCIYSHGACRHSNSCVKSDCPFDHPNRPRTCMACVNEIKRQRR